jgi:hypothetical protein
MGYNLHTNCTENRGRFYVFAWIVLLAATMGTGPLIAQTYISAEPIPSQETPGPANLASKLNSLASDVTSRRAGRPRSPPDHR